jgi:superfamily II DNA or RNA helicase
MGFLTEYRIFAPPTDIDLSDVNITNTGELNQKKMVAAVRKSHIVGDVVAHYKRIANGKLGVTFASDVRTATDIANRFNKAGVPAAVVSAKTPDVERIRILRDFKNRKLLQLVNVDLFGEGFDLPAIEVVSMARPTESYALYAQQFGRALRILDGKLEAIIIDHVGNVERHGLPDAPRHWTLSARSRTRGPQGIPLRTCLNPVEPCFQTYESVLPECPHCGFAPVVADCDRSSPELVEGDLVELDAATLAEMRGEVEKVDMPAAEYRAQLAARNVPAIGQMANVNRHLDRQEMQAGLRASIAWWAGYYRAQGQSDSEIYKRFFYTFRTDILSAQALKTKDALVLGEAINSKIGALEW